MTNHTPQSLIAFTDRVKAAFLDKKIAAPVHLNSSTQAEPLVDIFKSIRPQDWVFSTWRSTYHALLKGVPEEEVFEAILEGRSMYLMFKEYNFFSSAIVGGILPIALGVAAGISKNRSFLPLVNNAQPDCSDCESKGWYLIDGKPVNCRCYPLVYVFIGDMCSRTGLYYEFAQYANGHSLPIRVVCENNNFSTNARTEEVWGTSQTRLPVVQYNYERTEPHTGIGSHVTF